MTTTTSNQVQETQVDQMIKEALSFDLPRRSDLEEVGERFGLYEIMARCGPINPACLATQANISDQGARVWLDALVGGKCMVHHPSSDLYCLWSSWTNSSR